jgi:hypothetical protein
MAAQVIRALSSLTEVGVGLVVAVVIAMVSSWILAVVVVGFVPLLVVAGLVQVWLLGRRGGTRDHTHSSQVSPLLSPASPSSRAGAGSAGGCDAYEDSAVVWTSGDLLSEAQGSPEDAPQVRGHSAALPQASCQLWLSSLSE